MMNRDNGCIGILLLAAMSAGCAWTGSHDSTSITYSDLHRVHVVKQAGSAPVETRGPNYPSSVTFSHEWDDSPLKTPSPSVPAAPDTVPARAQSPIAAQAPLPPPFLSTAPASIPTVTTSSEMPHIWQWSAPLSAQTAKHEFRILGASAIGAEVEGSLDAAVIITHLNTSFQSSVPGLSWSESLTPGGSGFHGSIYWSPDNDETFYGVMGGYFASAAQSNRTDSNGFYSRETMAARCSWGAIGVKHYVRSWVYGKASLGSFLYDVRTQIETNAPSYAYDGVSGQRWIGAVGLGLGLETPWEFPLHAGVEGYWWIASNQDPPVEAGIGQVSINLLLRF